MPHILSAAAVCQWHIGTLVCSSGVYSTEVLPPSIICQRGASWRSMQKQTLLFMVCILGSGSERASQLKGCGAAGQTTSCSCKGESCKALHCYSENRYATQTGKQLPPEDSLAFDD